MDKIFPDLFSSFWFRSVFCFFYNPHVSIRFAKGSLPCKYIECIGKSFHLDQCSWNAETCTGPQKTGTIKHLITVWNQNPLCSLKYCQDLCRLIFNTLPIQSASTSSAAGAHSRSLPSLFSRYLMKFPYIDRTRIAVFGKVSSRCPL